MKKWWKRVACVALAVLLAGALAACRQETEPEPSQQEPDEVSSTVKETPPASPGDLGTDYDPLPASDGDLDTNYYDETSPASPGDLSDWEYDPMVAAGAYSDHGALFADIQRNGKNLPDYVWWISEEALREAFGIEGYLDGQSAEGIAHFSCRRDEDDWAQLARQYGLTAGQMQTTAMTSWPYSYWAQLASSFDWFVTLRPTEETPVPDAWVSREMLDTYAEHMVAAFDEEGNPLSDSAPEREPIEDYQPPEWEPVKDHAGYEMAVVEKTEDGVPLAVRLRWQKDGYWFLCQIPGHCLETFWQAGGSLWEKRELPGELPDDDEWGIAPKIETE